jgi:hypothetical protein
VTTSPAPPGFLSIALQSVVSDIDNLCAAAFLLDAFLSHLKQ